jgi:hypothetical protein
MKRNASILLLCFMISVIFTGCGNQTVTQEQTSQKTAIGNPWSDWDSIEEAESVIGFSFGLPEVIADSYAAAEIQTMNGELIEVVYRDEEFEVCVRKQAGEGQDISGDYNQYDICTEEKVGGATVICYSNSGSDALKQLISYQGYSWSMVAPNGYWGDSGIEFLNTILQQ